MRESEKTARFRDWVPPLGGGFITRKEGEKHPPSQTLICNLKFPVLARRLFNSCICFLYLPWGYFAHHSPRKDQQLICFSNCDSQGCYKLLYRYRSGGHYLMRKAQPVYRLPVLYFLIHSYYQSYQCLFYGPRTRCKMTGTGQF